MPTRTTRQLLAAALLGGSVASAAEPPKPPRLIPPPPVAPPMLLPEATFHDSVLFRCEVLELRTADLERIAKSFDAHRTATMSGWLFDAGTADRFRAACEASLAEVLSKPQLIVQDKQTGFFQVGQQFPLQTGVTEGANGERSVAVTYVNAGITWRLTPRVAGDGPRLEVQSAFSHIRPIPGGKGLDTMTVETNTPMSFGRTAVIEVSRGTDRTTVLCVTPDRVRHDTPPRMPMAAPPVAHATAVAPPLPAVAPLPVLPRPVAAPVMPVAPPMPVAAPAPVFPTPVALPPAPAPQVTKVYPVADLVTPIPMTFCFPPADPEAARKTTEAAVRRHAEQLQKLLTETVRPYTWAAAGGEGRIEFFPVGSTLTVRNSPDALAEVEKVLDAVRRTQDVQAATEVRVMCMPAHSAESLQLCGGLPSADKPVVLSADRRTQVLAALDGCREVRTVQMPKMTAFNGQAVDVLVGVRTPTAGPGEVVVLGHTADEPGVRMCVQPLVSADRRTVRTAVDAELRYGAEVLKVKRDAALPDGHTLVLFAGTRQPAPVCCEFGPPVLSRIPYVNRLFKNQGIGLPPAEDVFVLVTPRVIVAAEEEVRQTGGVAPAAKSPAAELVAKYHAALAAGKPDEAVRWAVQALAADPTAFGR